MTDMDNNGGRMGEIDPKEYGMLTQAVIDLKETVATGFVGVNTRLDKQNGRIGKLEQWRWKLGGGIAVAFALLTLFLKLKGAI